MACCPNMNSRYQQLDMIKIKVIRFFVNHLFYIIDISLSGTFIKSPSVDGESDSVYCSSSPLMAVMSSVASRVRKQHNSLSHQGPVTTLPQSCKKEDISQHFSSFHSTQAKGPGRGFSGVCTFVVSTDLG